MKKIQRTMGTDFKGNNPKALKRQTFFHGGHCWALTLGQQLGMTEDFC